MLFKNDKSEDEHKRQKLTCQNVWVAAKSVHRFS